MKRILVVEDEKFTSSAYRVKLMRSGFEVRIVMNGQEAIDALQEYIPDLIILDLIMPVKDGFATLQEIRANERWKTIPVLVASVLGQKEDVDRAIQLGANDYMVKTDITPAEILVKVNALTSSTPA